MKKLINYFFESEEEFKEYEPYIIKTTAIITFSLILTLLIRL